MLFHLPLQGYGPQTSKSVSEDISNEVRESPDALLVEELVSNDKKKTIFPTVAKIEFVRPKQQERPVRKPVKERVVFRNNYTRVNYNYSAKKAHPSAHRNIVPRAVLMKTDLRPLNTVRPINTSHHKTIVYSAKPISHFSKSAQSTVKRPYQTRTTLTNKNFSQKVNTVKGNFYTARPKAVNTARPNSAVVNAVRANQVNTIKASACWVWRPTKFNNASITLKKHNYVDARGAGVATSAQTQQTVNGCGNMSHLSDFKESDGGYVTPRGGAKGGKITVKRTSIFKTDVGQKEHDTLLLDTYSKSRMLFGCSPDFKLAKRVSLNINTVSPTVTTAPLKATHADFFGDETEVDMSNITTTYLVPSTPNTRIHKDHSLDHVTCDAQCK
ncbi:hypothetical protein Tco_0693064 [Tanacetum coccineum]